MGHLHGKFTGPAVSPGGAYIGDAADCKGKAYILLQNYLLAVLKAVSTIKGRNEHHLHLTNFHSLREYYGSKNQKKKITPHKYLRILGNNSAHIASPEVKLLCFCPAIRLLNRPGLSEFLP